MSDLDPLLDRVADLLGFLDEIDESGGPNPSTNEIRTFFKQPVPTEEINE